MSETIRHALVSVQTVGQGLAMGVLGISAVALTLYTLACALGQAEWLVMPLQFGPLVVPQGGIWVQSVLMLLLILLCFYLPTNARILALETSHRRFQIGMRDVAMAYRKAHAADRKDVFTLSSEFDSVRERMAFLRDHPDLAELEPPILEVAAQMSHLSRELARTYSEANVARARDFLIQRQQDIEEFNARLEQAKAVANEMRLWVHRVELEESVAESQLARLCEELQEILPEIGLPEDEPPVATGAQDENDTAPVGDDRIVALLARRAAE